MGMLTSIQPMQPMAGEALQPAQLKAPQMRPLQNPMAGPSRVELQAVMRSAGNAGVPLSSPDDVAAVAQLFMAGHSDRSALVDVAWAVKQGGSVPDAVAKVLASRKPIGGA